MSNLLENIAALRLITKAKGSKELLDKIEADVKALRERCSLLEDSNINLEEELTIRLFNNTNDQLEFNLGLGKVIFQTNNLKYQMRLENYISHLDD